MIDSNILLDIFTEDKEWFEWSSTTVAKYANLHEILINPIIYAEVSVGFDRIENLEEVLPKAFFVRTGLPYEAAFLAGKCFDMYRKRKGIKRSPLPDFFIGAHASVLGVPLATRDIRRYRTYFPKLELITP